MLTICIGRCECNSKYVVVGINWGHKDRLGEEEDEFQSRGQVD